MSRARKADTPVVAPGVTVAQLREMLAKAPGDAIVWIEVAATDGESDVTVHSRLECAQLETACGPDVVVLVGEGA